MKRREAEAFIRAAFALWQGGLIDKWDFYPLVIELHSRVPFWRVAELTNVRKEVIEMRVRDIRAWTPIEEAGEEVGAGR